MPPPMPPLPVQVVTVKPRQVPIIFEHLARSEPSKQVEIRARISGFLESRHFVEGKDVADGELLFELDARTLRAQEVTARAEIEAATARQVQAQREAARLQPLVAEQAVTQREADDAVSAARIAAAQLAAAKARLQQIEVDLEYTRITAPFAGRIGRTRRDEGSLVAPTADGLLTTLVQLDPCYVRFQRTEQQQTALERDLASGRLVLPAGGRFAVEVQDREGTVLAKAGVIDFEAVQLDTMTGTIPMRATMPNPELRLLAGQSVKVVLRGAKLADAITVPQRAVLESPRGKIVMVAVTGEGGATVAEVRPVEVGEWVELPGEGMESRSWVVTAGLAMGERVIIDNLMRLRPGSPVQVATSPPAPAAGATVTPTGGR